MGKEVIGILAATAILLSSCQPVSPTAAPPGETAEAAPSGEPGPFPSATAETSPNATPLPPIRASCYPDSSAPLEDLVILRGPEYLFHPSCQVSGGVGQITASWDIDRDGNPESTDLDPVPMSLQAGEYNPLVTLTDAAGQVLTLDLPRIVKVGTPGYPSWQYGVIAHLNLNFGSYANYSEVERAIRMIADAGIQAVRVDFTWSYIEPHRGRFNWTDYDHLVRILREHHLEILPIVGYSTDWASSGSGPNWQDWFFHSPTDPTDYGEYLAQLIGRYKADIHVWQIWGEPNSSTYFREPSAATYTTLLKNAYLAAKYADPTALVVLGGLANDASAEHPEVTFIPPDLFLQEIYDHGGSQYFDAAARHPYATPNSDGFQFLSQQLTSFRQVMIANGDWNKQIWITESGWATYDQWSEEMQAQWLEDSYSHMAGLEYIGPLFWYNFRDQGTDPDEWQDNTGLIRRDWSPKPVYFSLRDFITSR